MILKKILNLKKIGITRYMYSYIYMEIFLFFFFLPGHVNQHRHVHSIFFCSKDETDSIRSYHF